MTSRLAVMGAKPARVGTWQPSASAINYVGSGAAV